MIHWLDEPLPTFQPSDLPDPLERCGRHAVWACAAGVTVSHREWTVTHFGACPATCLPTPKVAPSCPQGYSQAASAWAALVGKPRKVRKPETEWVKTERVVPLNLDALY